ncbi:cytochrome c biogenesis protein CcsA [bacterium BMS3Bbin06]|nr:cytochrome c biogenesis protein CcsA [bacterium BMS3Abin08]GBE35720.1 cytochrome c biogenesis protein CcsA [bacterium BMS3Bbin06]HDO36500.1 cytochrome C biogenesis protein ResC [Nitrospirota bacterium]HDY70189.1 cytochrome C biogenesis protein ResC [Nitrospirota bacterium]
MITLIAFLPIPLFLFSIFRRPLLYVAVTLQGGYLLYRGALLGRIPLVGLHDTLLFLSLSTALFAIPFQQVRKEMRWFLEAVALISAVFSLAGFLSPGVDTPLPPVLKTYWFELHVVLSFFSYGLFGIGAVLGLHVFRNDDNAEGLQYRAILIGYLLFSLSMVFGGIWAYLAWGTYWLWTPKEIWTVLIWLVYTLYLHLRFRPWWRGRRIAAVGIVGYLMVLFTYLGVGLLMKSSHSFQ